MFFFRLLVLLSATFHVTACASHSADAVLSHPIICLPPRSPLLFRTTTESFDLHYEYIINDGAVFSRKRNHPQQPFCLFDLVGRAPQMQPNQSVVALAADGDNLVIVDDKMVVHYIKTNELQWQRRFGPFPRILRAPQDGQLLMSHRGQAAGHFEDGLGVAHPIWAGVTTLFWISNHGTSLRFADPWLPSDFEYPVCLPRQGQFQAAAAAASASTLFVLGKDGSMYTRLADYDILGQNPFLPYTYDPHDRKTWRGIEKRLLPPENWEKQPPLPEGSTVGRRIMIDQIGKGNQARILRVSGCDISGKTGYFEKKISAKAWVFVENPSIHFEPLVLEPVRPFHPTTHHGLVTFRDTSLSLPMTVDDFAPECAPARVRMTQPNGTVAHYLLHTRYHGWTRQLEQPHRQLEGRLLRLEHPAAEQPEAPIPFKDIVVSVPVQVFLDSPTSWTMVGIEQTWQVRLIQTETVP
jgi:hypothetical protein